MSVGALRSGRPKVADRPSCPPSHRQLEHVDSKNRHILRIIQQEISVQLRRGVVGRAMGGSGSEQVHVRAVRRCQLLTSKPLISNFAQMRGFVPTLAMTRSRDNVNTSPRHRATALSAVTLGTHQAKGKRLSSEQKIDNADTCTM